MVRQRQMSVEIVAVPTVRDSDGLALSSRNLRLNERERETALVISKGLYKALGKESLSDAKFALVKTLSQEPGLILDYAAIIDEDTFELAISQTIHKRALVAGWVGEVRLIDNMAMTSVEQ
jgi:pantoate--beta-alanine ligase